MGRAAEAWLEEDSPSHPFPAAVSHGACYYYSAATRGSQTTREGGITKKPGRRSLMDRQPGGGRRDVFRSQSN